MVAYVRVAERRRRCREDARDAGAMLFADNCASCHGEDGTGDQPSSARPNLTDALWIYGGDEASLFETVYGGRHGWMPAWEGRLGLAERKILTIYIQDRGEETVAMMPTASGSETLLDAVGDRGRDCGVAVLFVAANAHLDRRLLRDRSPTASHTCKLPEKAPRAFARRTRHAERPLRPTAPRQVSQ